MWLNHWLEPVSALNHWPAARGAPVLQRVPVFQSSAFARELPDCLAAAGQGHVPMIMSPPTGPSS
jgi:hypothetical protein